MWFRYRFGGRVGVIFFLKIIICSCGWNVEGWIWVGFVGVVRVYLRVGVDVWGKKRFRFWFYFIEC